MSHHMLLNIENRADLIHYLEQKGYAVKGEKWDFKVLSGGVSNRTVWVRKEGGTAWVLKQALEKLRVQTEWYSDPRRIRQEALGLEWFSKSCPKGSVPDLLFIDESNYLLGMEAISEPHMNYKHLLLQGDTTKEYFQQLGKLLGSVHRRGQDETMGAASIFSDYSFFETLRLEPYYVFTAQQLRGASQFFQDLIEETRKNRYTLVHGDYSPKNILVHAEKLVLLDYEVAHFGDGTFDIGFLLTHLLSKANHLEHVRAAMLAGARIFWKFYLEEVSTKWTREQETRAIRHTLACLLARVHGRSPLEYLTESERQIQTQIALSLIQNRPDTVLGLIENFQLNLSNA